MNNGYYSPDGNPQPEAEQTPIVKRSKLAITSFITGIIGLFISAAYSICAVILALVDKKATGELSGKTRAGLILGWIGIIYRLMVLGSAIVIFLTHPELPESIGKIIDAALAQANALQ